MEDTEEVRQRCAETERAAWSREIARQATSQRLQALCDLATARRELAEAQREIAAHRRAIGDVREELAATRQRASEWAAECKRLEPRPSAGPGYSWPPTMEDLRRAEFERRGPGDDRGSYSYDIDGKLRWRWAGDMRD